MYMAASGCIIPVSSTATGNDVVVTICPFQPFMVQVQCPVHTQPPKWHAHHALLLQQVQHFQCPHFSPGDRHVLLLSRPLLCCYFSLWLALRP
jgi:hypothetical protein